MNHLCLVVCFINIFVFSVNSAPTTPVTSNIFDLIENYSVKNCPALSKNVLIDKNLTYLRPCHDVSLENVPANVAFDSMNPFLCVAILEADFRLCNAVSNDSYVVANSFEELRVSVMSARNYSGDEVCTELKNFPSTFDNSSDIGVKLAPWMSKFNERLFTGSGCTILCSDFDGRTNVFCSLLWTINAHVQKVTQLRNVHAATLPKVPVNATAVENMKPKIVERVLIPLGKPKLIPANASEAVKVQPHVEPRVEPQIKTTKAPPTTTKLTTTTAEPTSTKQLLDSVNVDMENKSQSVTKAAVKIEKAVEKTEVKLPVAQAAPVQVPADKEPVLTDVKPKESDQIEKQNIEVKLPSDVVENSAPEPINTVAENKLETPEIKQAETDKMADMETTDKVVNSIFDTTVLAGFKDSAKQDNYIDDDDEGDGNFKIEDPSGLDKEQESAGAVISDQSITPREYADVEDSNFFAYFMFVSVVFIAGYVLYHNKQKILALVLEGRRDRNARRRPNTASYRKLNSNLEEAVTSKCSGSAAHVIY